MRMTSNSRSLVAVSSLLLSVLTCLPDGEAARKREVDPNAPVEITRLGANACRRPPLKTGEELKQLIGELRGPIQDLLKEAAYAGNPEDLFGAVADGKFTEKDYPVGQKLQWMMTQKKKGQYSLIHNAVWAGKQPLHGYEITFVSNWRNYTFLVPSICGNLAYLDSSEIPHPQPVCKLSVSPASDCITRALTVELSCSVSSGSIKEIKATVTGPDGKTQDLGKADGTWKWTRNWNAPGTYTFSASATSDLGQVADPVSGKAELKPCPPNCALSLSVAEILAGEEFMVDASASKAQVGEMKSIKVEVVDAAGAKVTEMDLASPFKTATHLDKAGTYTYRAVATDTLGQSSSNTCSGEIIIRPKLGWLTDFFSGKERRVRTGFSGGRCAPLLGGKLGLSYLISPTFEFNAAVGSAFNLRDGDNYSVFVDTELNYVGKGAFIGSGIGWWDITHKPTSTADWLVQFGVYLPSKVGWRPMSLFVQGRVPLNRVNDIENNYIVWGGLRLQY